MNKRSQLKAKVASYKKKLGLLATVECTSEENKLYAEMVENDQELPKNVFPYMNWEDFYKVIETDLTEEEIDEYLKYKKLSMIRTIKNCFVYFTTIYIISLSISVIGLLMALSSLI